MGNFEKVEALYKQYQEAAADNEIRSFFAIKYARYQAKVSGNMIVVQWAMNTQ